MPELVPDVAVTEPAPDIVRLAIDAAELVYARAESFTARVAQSPEQEALLAAAVRGLRNDAGAPYAGSLHFPLFVYAGLRGELAPAIDLAAALVLLNLGIHILDDLGDGDLPAHWAGFRPSEIMLAGTACIGVIPQLLLAEIDAPAETVVRLLRTLATGLVRIGAGQQADLRLCDSETATPDEVLAAVRGKSGERRVAYARLAGELAGASDEEISPYEELGRQLGIVAQLTSDCADLFSSGADATDLMNGTRTLPIVLRLAPLRGQERSDFVARLDAARRDRDVRMTVCEELRAAGIPMAATLYAEVHRQQALRALEAARPRQPGRAGLEAMVAAFALFGAGAPASDRA